MPFKSPESNRARTKCYGCLVGEDRQIIDYDAVVALEGRHGFAGEIWVLDLGLYTKGLGIP
jgi:hypothetical protein